MNRNAPWSRLPIALTVVAMLCVAGAARASSTLTDSGPALMMGTNVGTLFSICIGPIACAGSPHGTIVSPAPFDLNAFADPLQPGVHITGLTMVYAASSSDNGLDVTLTWRGSRPFVVAGGPGAYSAASFLDGTLVYDATKFTVSEVALVTSFLDFPGTVLQLAPVPSGGSTFSFAGAAPPNPVTLNDGVGTTQQFFAMTFHQISAGSGDTITLNLPGSAISTAVAPVQAFATLAARLQVEPRHGNFQLASVFTLASASNGIHPATEDVTLQIGTTSITIPAGSFRENGGDGKPGKPRARFAFQGVVDGVRLEVKIVQTANGSYELDVNGHGANLTPTVNPVTVGLGIGDEGSSIAVIAKGT